MTQAENLDLAREIAALEQHLEAESYDDALLEQAEQLLARAFRPAEPLTLSPSDVFTGGRPRSGSMRLKRCSRSWTEMVHAPETRRAHFSRPLLQPGALEGARVMRIVSELPESQLCWLRHVFMPDGPARQEYSQRYQATFWREFCAAFDISRLDRVLLQRMAVTMVQSFGSWRFDYLIQTTDLWELFGASKSNWNQRYAPHWRTMERLLALHHQRCLMAVLNAA
ncbi:MAG: hypothetical protein M0Q49_02290 [Porticoccaceae bacterium]|jgi:hypothetical protein|nr:hypothetical protein [Porticoccaceae bacterium]